MHLVGFTIETTGDNLWKEQGVLIKGLQPRSQCRYILKFLRPAFSTQGSLILSGDQANSEMVSKFRVFIAWFYCHPPYLNTLQVTLRL